MNRMWEMKRRLGRDYLFRRHISSFQIRMLKKQMPKYFNEIVFATLMVGCVKMDAVLYRKVNEILFGYNVYVKAETTSMEWIIFEYLKLETVPKEEEMFAVLDEVVTRHGLSYTECKFERLKGKETVAKKRE